MRKSREISDYEIIKGCAEYLQISEANIINDNYMQDHSDILDVLVNVAINCKKKPRRESMIVHRQTVVHNLGCNNIVYATRREAEIRTRERMLEDEMFQILIEEIINFIIEKDYMNSDLEVINFKVVGYHGKKKDVVIPDGLQLGEYAFSNCTTIESVTLNKEIKEIPESAFSNCKKLTDIYGLEHLEKIGCMAFWNCKNLRKIDLPPGITEIDDHTFCGCTALEEMTIPTGVIEIGYAAFRDCKSLRIIKFPKGLKEIHAEAFLCCSSLEEIEIPESIERIDNSAFDFCKNLKHITFLNIPKN